MKPLLTFILISVIWFTSCRKEEPIIEDPIEKISLYFPEPNSSKWETTTLDSLGWNEEATTQLYSFLENNGTRAFILLKDGKIVLEQYWGKTILNTSDFNEDSQWYWASAGKTITATLVGIAQQEGFLDINNTSSTYLGSGWTNMPSEKEALITVQNQLCMTTGADYTVSATDCTDPECIQYGVDAGEQWFYHNATYTLLDEVLQGATGENLQNLTNEKIGDVIGMNGNWIELGYNNVYWSTAREMARFGLLMLNEGQWGTTPVLQDSSYYHQMVNSSQELNPAYGYLWWLNGKNSIIYPTIPTSFNQELSPAAPDDLFAGIGKNGQFLDVVPSKNIVVVRMGEAPGDDLVPTTFHDEMWTNINAIIEQ